MANEQNLKPLNKRSQRERKEIARMGAIASNEAQANKKVLIVVDELNDNLILSSRNLNNVLLLSVDEINTFDVVYADTMIITENAVKQLEEVLV